MSDKHVKRDVYQEVTDRIVAALEEGTVPWRKPWTSVDGPHNPVSGTFYRGVNPFLLELTAQARGYDDPRWITFKQAQGLGGQVQKGERGTLVTFWKMLKGKDEQTGESKSFPMLRHYVVFNAAAQTSVELEPLSPVEAFDPIERAETIVAGMPNAPTIGHGGDSACYMPAMDHVQMPKPETFPVRERYYSTAFHELVHATGHESRLNRPEVAQSVHAFGSDDYSREELVAELGAAMLCGHAGIIDATAEQSAAYCRSWLNVLKDDRKMMISAAGRAQRAADYVRNVEVAV